MDIKKLKSYEERLLIRKSKLFKSTNCLWNKYRFNDINKIGCLSLIFENFLKSEENINLEKWEDFYFKSGLNRKTIKNNKINSGRTIKEIEELSKSFSDKSNISYELALNFCYIRIIDETFTGFIRELNAINQIKDKLSDKYKIIKTSFINDMKFAIDYEIFFNKRLIMGIQIKSKKYKKRINLKKDIVSCNIKAKNFLYKKLFGVNTLYVFSDENGSILNLDCIITFIQNIAESKIIVY